MTSALFFNAETSAFSVFYGGIFMFFSLAIILLFGLLLGGICKKLRLPSLIGMLAVGIIIGPYALNLIDTSILEISAQLRKIALIIILARAGLSLNVSELKKVGRPAIMMCFVPAWRGIPNFSVPPLTWTLTTQWIFWRPLTTHIP